MRTVALVFSAIIMLAVVACGDEQTGAPAPAPTDTPLPAPTAPASAALKAPEPTPTITPVAATAAAVAPDQSPTPTHTSVPTSTATPAPTQAPTPAPTSTRTPTLAPVPTDTPTSSPTAAETPSPVSTATQPPTASPTPVPRATDTPVPTATHTATATNTPVPTATETPVPTATATPTPIPTETPTPTPTNTPVPTPSVDPALAGYSPLLVEAVSSYPARLDFVGDGLSADEKNVLDWADSRLFSNPNFLASKYGPDNWPSDVKLASVQAVPLLMLAIDIQVKTDGKHVISWELDGLDRILDELGVYEGVCTSCYGKSFDARNEVSDDYYRITDDPGHAHREMLKTFAYLAKADGEGVLIRGFMENDADDLELLYDRDPEAARRVGSVTDTAFGWRNLSFMSQVKLPDGSLKSFPTMVYEIVGGAGSEREAAERWFDNFNAVMSHFVGGVEEFADIYRKYSQTPYTPEPGYVLSVGLAGSPSSTGTTVSALRALGLKAEQFLSAVNGYRTGAVEIGSRWYYHDGNAVFPRLVLPMCVFLLPLDVHESNDYDKHCGYPTPPNESSEDRAALVALYDATGGPDWKRNQHWVSESSMRQWRGVVVNHESGRVTHLMLTSNGLRGELPSELDNLAELEELLLAGNGGLTGCVPAVLRARLKRHTGVEFCESSSGQPETTGGQGDRPVSVDRAPLVALYSATGGDNWGNNDKWLSDQHVGEWSGVTVDEDGRVTELDLSRQRLTGEIPSDLGALANLRRLNLGDNDLSGEIPIELGDLANLESLYLAGNQLAGKVPDELANLTNLEGLYLSRNRLNGDIPPELGGLSNLKWLYLNRNRLTGEIPPELGSLTNLIRLDLQYNRLTGQIPPELGKPSNLRWLYVVGGNQLTGCIPAELARKSVGQPVGFAVCTPEAKSTLAQVKEALTALYNATNGPGWKNNANWLSETPVGQWHGVATEGEIVTLLNLSDNNLAGPIPPELGSLADLKLLNLSRNQLIGTIPPELGNLSELKTLRIELNQLTGPIPTELGNLSNLVVLYLGGNQLSGKIPPELGNLGLISLNLVDNHLSGKIPTELSSLSVLLYLYLGGNELSGPIPAELGSLSYLKRLSLSRNQLSGEIPEELGNLTNLESLNLAGNRLTGCIPKELQNVEENDFADSALPFC